MSTNLRGFEYCKKKSLHPCALDESSLSIGKVKGKTIYILGEGGAILTRKTLWP